MIEAPKVGSRWRLKPPPVVPGAGQRPVRVMAVADGYVMVRYPGAVPFIKSVKEFFAEFEQQADATAGT